MKIFKRINDSYIHTRQFCELMRAYESNNYRYDKASVKDSEYIELDEWRKTNMENNKNSVIIGSLLFMIFNPSFMIKSQKYYSGKFNKPCDI